MTKHSVVVSTRESWCFDTVWRQHGSMRRQKQGSLQQSIVHLSKPLTQSEMREVRPAADDGCCIVPWSVAGWGWRCGRLLISLWTSVASIRRAVSHQRGEVRAEWSGFMCVANVWWSRQTTAARQTGSPWVLPVSIPVVFPLVSRCSPPSLPPSLQCWNCLY